MVAKERPMWAAFLLAFFGFSVTIIIHECGHFFAALLFGVPIEVFSLGFGPALFTFYLGVTAFQLSLFPFGGYVLINPNAFREAPLVAQYVITISGIICNLLCTYLVCFVFALGKKQFRVFQEEVIIETSQEQKNVFVKAWSLFIGMLKKLNELTLRTLVRSKTLIAGPITIIKGLIAMAQNGMFLYLLSIAILNVNLALFNVLPLPFLDGSRIVQITVEAFFGQQSFSVNLAITLFIFFLFMTILSYLQQYMMYKKTENGKGIDFHEID